MSMNSLGDIWKAVLDKLGENLTSTSISTWFDDCVPVEIDGSTLVLQTSSDFKRDIIVSRFSETIKNAMSEIFSTSFGLTVLTEDELGAYREKKKDDDPLPEMAGYTFDRFIVGNSNRFAHNAAVAVAEKPGGAYNPLFIYGNSGLGKTHLLLAIGQFIRERTPSAKIAYIKGDEFTNQLLKSIKDGTGEEFRMKYRNVDLFLVDDIQFIAGKQATQEEFFHTFNNIYEAGHQIVITSDRPPIEMSLLDDRLMSRFQGGLMADIQPPDIETRMVITRAKAAQLGLILDDDAVKYIADTITTNVRTIEGVINRLTAYREILDSRIDAAAVRRAIKDVARIGTFIPSPQLIIRESARYFSLSEEDLRGQNRSKNTATARQISMYLVRTLTNLPLKDIGAEYGDRNHSTVLSSIRKVEELIKEDPKFAATVRDITSNINSV
ncbi:MAG: chromosomal replication initiator protein DnaA [Oscillibacter sp.]|nr:chromosomal replication initiator protein DnaA [Oscillibacter sp.]MDY3079299.1 chromosomal replication initiator protein DnaA [Oscillospiraceae bacterium]